jgi:hypothetical protein
VFIKRSLKIMMFQRIFSKHRYSVIYCVACAVLLAYERFRGL